MARQKEFNPDKALEKAMHLFWLQGYKATSVQNLCDHMGLQKGSLYDTFGSKRSLFLAALNRYRQLNDLSMIKLEPSDSARAAIETLFNQLVDLSAADELGRGCFVVNTIVELASSNPTIAQFGAAVRQEYRDLFLHLLLAAEERGEISPHQNLPALAHYLTNAMFGLRVTAKTTRNRAILEDIVATTLASIQ